MDFCRQICEDEQWDEISPRSFTLASKHDLNLFEAYFTKNQGLTFIAKPVSGGQGDGLTIFRSLNELHKLQGQVVQEYIDRPLLIGGLKFDLRVYVVTMGSGTAMRSYICNEGLARFCTKPYQKVTNKNLRDEAMHFTNYSITKMSKDYI